MKSSNVQSVTKIHSNSNAKRIIMKILDALDFARKGDSGDGYINNKRKWRDDSWVICRIFQ